MEYENRITGSREKIAQAAVTTIGKIMEVAVAAMVDPGAKVSLMAGCAVPALCGIALSFSDKPTGQYHATADETILGAFYMIACVEDCGTDIATGFSPEYLATALRLYKQVMGREYTDIGPTLRKILEQEAASGKNVPDQFKKFIPN